MIRHIVCWKFLENAEGCSKEENLRKAKSMLDALPGAVPGILSFEVGFDMTQGPGSFDMALNSTFESVETMHAYQRHPAHMNVVPFLRRVQSEKSVVDYDCPPR